MICKLALEDGTVFTGVAFGATGTRTGEVVFNTAHTGYQEIFTDPSYCGQIVTMTFPLMGNYGVNLEDFESSRPFLSGFVVKEAAHIPSNYRATASLPEFLAQHGIIGLAGIDTRSLTRRIRVHGALRGVISTEISSDLELVRLAIGSESMVGANLVPRVSSGDVHGWNEPLWSPDDAGRAREPSVDGAGGAGRAARAHRGRPAEEATAAVGPQQPHIVVVDCGIKHNILRHLVESGARATVAPAGTTPDQIRALRPDALLVGNGPGDPAAVTDTIDTLRALLGEQPTLGICLGHQMLALALGAKTYKLRFGHHGANVPVLNCTTGRVEITSQNHGFAVDSASLMGVGGTVTHINLNDESLEGFLHDETRSIAVQFHPEASPGPHDAGYLFRRFIDTVREGKPVCSVLQDT
jgi:carbamoyl-phosphate synthase small subunit